jgi:hypothetical protein
MNFGDLFFSDLTRSKSSFPVMPGISLSTSMIWKSSVRAEFKKCKALSKTVASIPLADKTVFKVSRRDWLSSMIATFGIDKLEHFLRAIQNLMFSWYPNVFKFFVSICFIIKPDLAATRCHPAAHAQQLPAWSYK